MADKTLGEAVYWQLGFFSFIFRARHVQLPQPEAESSHYLLFIVVKLNQGCPGYCGVFLRAVPT
jgi:hypothetical protein